jgi:hypothetical protein
METGSSPVKEGAALINTHVDLDETLKLRMAMLARTIPTDRGELFVSRPANNSQGRVTILNTH